MPSRNIITGCLFAAAAAIIWSGNFIVARGIANEIPPVSLAFYRWLIAVVVLAPFAWPGLQKEMDVVRKNWFYIMCAGFSGIALFNTCLYIAGHYSEAINLALIGTSVSPVVSIVLARIFLHETISPQRIAGLLLCITGILFLLSKGSVETLLQFRINTGDRWILLAAFSFAIYNTLVRKKPPALSSLSFLFTVFLAGTLLLLPFFLWETTHSPAIQWNASLIWIMIYIGIGASVLAFYFWNRAIAKLGAARTSLFGYLIPVFSSIGAVWLLDEKITPVHLVCGGMVIGGLVLANLPGAK